jgi:hypothetical protein
MRDIGCATNANKFCSNGVCSGATPSSGAAAGAEKPSGELVRRRPAPSGQAPRRPARAVQGLGRERAGLLVAGVKRRHKRTDLVGQLVGAITELD